MDYEVGLQCHVNGKRGHCWTLVIAYEPNDTYTVWLVEGHRGRKPDSMVLGCEREVFCDTLRGTIEAVHDRPSASTTRGSSLWTDDARGRSRFPLASFRPPPYRDQRYETADQTDANPAPPSTPTGPVR